VTDEESTGAGGLAAVAHGVRADAGIVTGLSAARRIARLEQPLRQRAAAEDR
jgi:hypothetical protein